MLRPATGIFILLHGLVHLWLVTLSLRLIPFEPAMGWTGRSWIFTKLLGDSPTRILATVLFVLSTIGFAVGGVGLIAQAEWYRPLLLGTGVVSAAALLLFWDGGMEMIVQKGLLGLLIDVGIVVAVLAGVV